MTQKTDVAEWLMNKGTLTRLEAFTELGVAELSARIIDLESEGYEIPRKTVEVTARNGRKARVTQYQRPTKTPADRDLFALCAR